MKYVVTNSVIVQKGTRCFTLKNIESLAKILLLVILDGNIKVGTFADDTMCIDNYL